MSKTGASISFVQTKPFGLRLDGNLLLHPDLNALRLDIHHMERADLGSVRPAGLIMDLVKTPSRAAP